MKKVIFTETQMKHILGEDVFNGVYNDMTSKGTEYPVDSIPATQSEVIATEPGGEPFITDKYSDEKTPDSYMTKTGRYHAMYESSRKKKVVKNDEGKIVPEVCPKCGSKVGLYIKGEPVYLCSNEKCGEYFGTMPFSKHLEKEMEEMDKEIAKREKHLDERNEKMDKKKMFKAPPEVRKAAIPDGVHDEALERIRNGEPVSIEELYTWRTRGFGNDTIDRWVKQEVAMAQALGASLRNSAGTPEQKNINKANTAITSDGSTVYYDNR